MVKPRTVESPWLNVLLSWCHGSEWYIENEFESPWLREIHNILNICGLGNLFYVETPNFSVKWLQARVTRSLHDQFVQNWQAEVQQKVICILYKSFKTDFKFENCLINLTEQQSLAICKFRTSNRRLRTELGRHTNIHTPCTHPTILQSL